MIGTRIVSGTKGRIRLAGWAVASVLGIVSLAATAMPDGFVDPNSAAGHFAKPENGAQSMSPPAGDCRDVVALGRLEQFEKSVTEPKPPVEPAPLPEKKHHRHHPDHPEDTTTAPAAVSATSTESGAQVSLVAPPSRRPGDLLFPFVRFDLAKLYVDENVSAERVHAELGFEFMSLQIVRTTYREKGVDTALRATTNHAKIRVYDSEGIELGAGLGYANLDGTDHRSGISGTLSMALGLGSKFGLEFFRTWIGIGPGPGLVDDEVAVAYGRRFWSVRIGYHNLESPSDRLGAWFAGASFRY